ncbi:MAG: GFA family protein [Actinobacteria bacterium]|nr:GFA family protein [Actinomycetota bacterium]
MSASPQTPLTGRCGCGAVRFEVRAPFESSRYCHCHRCQHRTGTAAGASARVARAAVEFTSGIDLIRAWEPAGGMPKAYCVECGGHLFSGSLEDDLISIRLGAIEGDPGIRPELHQWVSSAATWEELPEDGLPRYEEAGP